MHNPCGRKFLGVAPGLKVEKVILSQEIRHII